MGPAHGDDGDGHGARLGDDGRVLAGQAPRAPADEPADADDRREPHDHEDDATSAAAGRTGRRHEHLTRAFVAGFSIAGVIAQQHAESHAEVEA